VNREIREINISLSHLESINNFDEVMVFCKKYLSNLRFIWENADIGDKHKFLSILFPEGLKYDKKCY